MPRKVHTADTLRARLDNARTLLLDTRPKLAEAVERANSDTDDGLKPTSLQPPVSNGNGPTDLFERAYTKIGKGENARWVPKRDAINAALQTLVACLDQAAIAAAGALTAASELCAISPAEAQRLLEETEDGSCANCSKPVARTRADPLRAGRCFDCYRYRLSHEGAERPRSLWAP